MKTILLFTAFLMSAHLGFSQRTMNLKAELVSPAFGSNVQYDQMLNVSVEITNLGTVDLTDVDSLRVLLTYNGNVVYFYENSQMSMYSYRSGIPINAGQTFTHVFTLAFNEFLIQDDLEICFTIDPINAVNPIVEEDLLDNKTCTTINVVQSISSVGIGKVSEDIFSVYPNPTSDVIHVVKASENAISLVDLNGKEIRTFAPYSTTLDVKDVPRGLYFLRVNEQDQSKQIRISIQ